MTFRRPPAALARRVVVAATLLMLISGVAYASEASSRAAPRLGFSAVVRLAGAEGGTEPQVTVAPDGTRYLISGANTTSNSASGSPRIFRSPPGSTKWTPTHGQMVGVRVAGPDVDIAAATTGRLVALEQDSAALSLVINYSDDGGRSWHQSAGLDQLADQDRPWLAAGPHGSMYLLFHNGFSSNATHNMYVATSTDGGADFGAPVPVTLPGTDAWADLQCADSGGPSALLVSARTGRIYAVWTTRHGPLGGCGVQPLTPFTLVPADRVWVATSAVGALGTWTTRLAVDYSATGRVVGMQMSPAVLDTAGNLWLAWTTPPHPYPDDSGAGIAAIHVDPLLRHWSKPITLVPAGQPGHVLAQLVAGTPGRIGLLFLTGIGGMEPRWYPQVETVTGATGPHPITELATLSKMPDYKGSATALEGSGCDPDTTPVATVENNPVTCARSADVIGMALDKQCRMVVTWPSLSPASSGTLGVSTDATWVATQAQGPRLC